MEGAGERLAIGALSGLLAVAGSWAASDLGSGDRWWAVPAALAVASLVALALPALGRLLGYPGLVPLALLGWLAAVYGCVPETDHVPAAAVLLAGAAVVEVVTRRCLGYAWWLAGAVAVLWSGLYGATGRPSALVGALFGAWVVLLGPLLALVARLGRTPTLVRWTVVAVGVAAALIVSRTGALEPTVAPALRSVALWSAVSLAAALLIVLPAVALNARRERLPRR